MDAKKGFGDWVPIFQGGYQEDSYGNVHDGDEMIEKAVMNFDSKVHEPPVVVGHPKDNMPAFGWVAALKQAVNDGKNVLMAKFKQVAPEFEDWVQKGMYKKRSASFYPNGTLRHVGFLGAVPPAVQGLPDIKFSSSTSTLEFFQKTVMETDQESNFTENDVQRIVDEKVREERKRSERVMAEKERLFKRHKQNLKIINFIEEKVKGGILPPAIVQMGLVEFMQELDDHSTFEFSENEESTALEFMIEFIERLSKFPIFNEIATKQNVCDGKAMAETAMGESIAQLVE